MTPAHQELMHRAYKRRITALLSASVRVEFAQEKAERELKAAFAAAQEVVMGLLSMQDSIRKMVREKPRLSVEAIADKLDAHPLLVSRIKTEVANELASQSDVTRRQ